MGVQQSIIRPKPKLLGLGDVYDAADVCILASKSEASPLSVIEAWHSKTPIVTSEYQTLLDIEEEFSGGLPLTYHISLDPEPEEVVRAVLRAYDDTEKRAHRAACISRYHFTASRMTYNWEQYLHNCLELWFKRNRYGSYETAVPYEEYPSTITSYE